LPQLSWQSVAGGMLVQHHDRIGIDVRSAKVVSKRQPTAAEWSALDVAWRMCAAVKSNAITIARTDVLLSAGGGQTSRVDSARIAVQKAAAHHHNIKGTAAGSDAFFPFADGVEVLAEAGITAIAQPGGSKRDDEVIAVADKHNIAMVLTGMRHFRH
jgi:phosphoribosylaminoimidazolecarboxamide formyltransferase / IMP cyclohydrolase